MSAANLVRVRVKLRELVRTKGLPGCVQAVHLKLTPSAFGEIVNGLRNPREEDMKRFAEYHGQPARVIFPHEFLLEELSAKGAA